MKHFLLSMISLLTLTAYSQNGDELATAVECMDTVPVVASHVPNSTASIIAGLDCVVGGEDAFYYNTISNLDNKITISMLTDFGVVTTIDYQILRAPGGDVNNMVEIVCDSYEVTLGVSPLTPAEGFTLEVTSNINSGDVFYLRVYKPTDVVGVTLTDLFDSTDVLMTSEQDATLSVSNFNTYNLHQKVLVRDNLIELVNNSSFKSFKIYSLDGKIVQNHNQNQLLLNISTSTLNRGMYVLLLEDEFKSQPYKFVKK